MADANKLDNLNKELESIGGTATVAATQEENKKAAPKVKKKVATKTKVVQTTGKRKRAVARVRLMKGNGTLRINKKGINTLEPIELRDLILEPVNFSQQTMDIAKASDIDVVIKGGGTSSQAGAARTAIAKAIAGASGSDAIGRAYMKYDRTLMVDDIRQVEPKKFLGPKARSRFQKSYR